MNLLLAVCVILCLARGLYLRDLVERQQLLRMQCIGPLRLELRRQPHLAAGRDGMGMQTLPSPKETRTLVLRVAGLPVWREVQCITLPRHVQDSIDAVAAGDFDAAFSARFRVSPPVVARPGSPTGHPPATGAA